MMKKNSKPTIELDGRTGEGGGQLVRLAAALAAVTSQPIRITNVRGNRGGPRGGGLKAQHVSSIKWLVQATGAEVSGLTVGSNTLEFKPILPPTALKERNFKIVPSSNASSILLIFQAVLPFLLFAGTEAEDPIELEIQGGTNVSFSLSYEYLDQVFLPTLKNRFGVKVERKLVRRDWSAGPSKRPGSVLFKIHPIPLGQKLRPVKWEEEAEDRTNCDSFPISNIDISILAPYAMHESLQNFLAKDVDALFPGVDITFKLIEESSHDARMYALLVAHSKAAGGLIWGRDCLYAGSRHKKSPTDLSADIARKVSRDLYEDISWGGLVDEFLQDQLVVFQALSEGQTLFRRGEGFEVRRKDEEEGLASDLENKLRIGSAVYDGERKLRKDKTHEPFGEGSTHTTTARWVAAELLPGVKWYNNGRICEGLGISFRV